MIKDLRATKIAGEENKYQIHYKVWNTAQTLGIISLGILEVAGKWFSPPGQGGERKSNIRTMGSHQTP